MTRLLMLCALVGVALTAACDAGCPGGNCAVAATAKTAAPRYQWHKVAGHPDQAALYRDGAHQGNWNHRRGTFRPCHRGTWGDYDVCPVAPPKTPRGMRGRQNFGVKAEKIIPGKTTVNGHPVIGDPDTEAEPRTAPAKVPAPVEAPTPAAPVKPLPDDGKLPHLTVIGSSVDRGRVVEDLDKHPALIPLKGRYRLQEYSPEQWAVRDAGFVTTGVPTIYVQSPAGKPTARLDTYPGPDVLAAALPEALRKADPSYDPSKDPDPTRPLAVPPLLSSLAANTPPEALTIALCLGALCLGSRLLRRNPTP